MTHIKAYDVPAPQNWQEKVVKRAVDLNRSPLELKVHKAGLIIAGALFTLFTLGVGSILVKKMHTTYVNYQSRVVEKVSAKAQEILLPSPSESVEYKEVEKQLEVWAIGNEGRLKAKTAILECLNTKSEALTLANVDEFPQQLRYLTHLKTLTLQRITTPLKLTKEVGDLPNLKSLNIQQCRVDEDSLGEGSFSHLTDLNISLSTNSPLILPEKIFSLTHLKSLFLASNDLSEISSKIGDLKELESLTIMFSAGLRTLPTEVSKLTKLRILNLEKNGLQSQSLDEVPSLINLEKLYVQDNQILKVPSLKGLKSLQVLDLSHNKLGSYAGKIEFPDHLRVLKLGGNKIAKLDQEKLSPLKELEVLDLGLNDLIALPMGPESLPNLRELNLSDNQLEEIPLEITKLEHLIKLNISGNDLKSLPEGISKMKSHVAIYAHVALSDTSAKKLLETKRRDHPETTPAITFTAVDPMIFPSLSVEEIVLLSQNSSFNYAMLDGFDKPDEWLYPFLHHFRENGTSFESLLPILDKMGNDVEYRKRAKGIIEKQVKSQAFNLADLS